MSNTSELNNKIALNQAFLNAGLPENKINSLIKMVEERLVCDRDCQLRKQATNLKNTWNTSVNKKNELPYEIKNNEKKYYEFTEQVGLNEPGTYREILKTRYEKDASEMKTNGLLDLNKYRAVVDNNLNDYYVATDSEIKLKELLSIKNKEDKDILNKIDKYVKTTYTDERRIHYELEYLDSLDWYKNLILCIYYGILIAYIIFGGFITNYHYQNYKVWLFLILYLIVPFFLLSVNEKIVLWFYEFNRNRETQF